MISSIIPKMSYERKNKINTLINKIKDKAILKSIFTIVNMDINKEGDSKYTYNNNGIYFDLNILNESVLLEIENIVLKATITDNDSDTINYNIYSQDNATN